MSIVSESAKVQEKAKEEVVPPKFEDSMIEEEEVAKDVAPPPVKRPAWKIKLAEYLENYVVTGFMSSVTIYSLFFDDIRSAVFGLD